MSKRYVIQWKSKVNGRVGRGTKHFEQEEVERLVQELNQEYPDIEHESVSVEAKDPSATEPTEPTTILPPANDTPQVIPAATLDPVPAM